MQYRVVIAEGPTSFAASIPDLPGCVAVGKTREEVTGLIQEAIQIHLEAIDSSSISKAWRKELESRRAALRAGTVTAVPWAEAKARLRDLGR